MRPQLFLATKVEMFGRLRTAKRIQSEVEAGSWCSGPFYNTTSLDSTKLDLESPPRIKDGATEDM